MTTLTDFLLARIAEDETVAPRERGDFYDKPCPKCSKSVSGLGTPLDDEAVRALHPDDITGIGCALSMEQWQILMPDLGPSAMGARVLAECEAKRRIVEEHERNPLSEELGPEWIDTCRTCVDEHEPTVWPCVTLRALASVYADRPGYQQEWAP